ncbi:VOC family protein [Zobellella aerophila]|uniref:Dot/Icm type IV secretion system effector PhnB n=1 Tax=Zobellella aerophila TaxID=870480 RepID=A0ABP6VBG2_9GAMM
MPVKPIPEGYASVTPYLSIKGAAQAIAFYQQAFDAVELFRMAAPDEKIGHAELQIGNTRIMLADSCDQEAFRDPLQLGGSSIGLYLYVADVDAQFAKALAAGAREIREPQDQFYGDRTGTLADPFGHIWFLASHVEDLSEEDIARRAQELFQQADI